jgi:hypothetical protein
MVDRSARIYEFGDFRLDRGRRLLLRRDGAPVPLASKAFDTLAYLVEHPGTILDKDELMQAIWPDTAVEENNLTSTSFSCADCWARLVATIATSSRCQAVPSTEIPTSLRRTRLSPGAMPIRTASDGTSAMSARKGRP